MAFDPYKQKTRKMEQDVSYNKETLKDVKKKPFAQAPHRKISDETLEHFGVKMSLCEKDGETITAYYFPYFSQDGKITGYKKTDLTLDKEDKYYFTVVGRVNINCKMFGQPQSEVIDRQRKKIIIAEGEWDFLSAYDAIKEANKGTNWEGLEPFIVGIPLGTKNAADSVTINRHFITDFDEICIALDNDQANEVEKRKNVVKGKEATEEIAGVLVGEGLYNLDYQGLQVKDLNDILKEHGYEKLNKMLSFGFKKLATEKVVTASDIGYEVFTKKREEGIYVNAFPDLMEKIHGFRKRELVVVTAPSGAGKSTCVAEIAHALASANQRVGNMFLEEETPETLQRMASKYLEINYNYFKHDPQKYATDEQLKEAFDWCSEENRFVFLDHFGTMQVKELMNKIKLFVYQYKVDFIMLDHLSLLVTGKGNDERSSLEEIMVELAGFCESHDVGIIAVSHLNRGILDDLRGPKGKDDQPFWVRIRKENMKGSSALEQLAWIILALEPQIMPDRTRGNVRWSVLKNRPWSYLGIADEFNTNDKTGSINLVQTEEEF